MFWAKQTRYLRPIIHHNPVLQYGPTELHPALSFLLPEPRKDQNGQKYLCRSQASPTSLQPPNTTIATTQYCHNHLTPSKVSFASSLFFFNMSFAFSWCLGNGNIFQNACAKSKYSKIGILECFFESLAYYKIPIMEQGKECKNIVQNSCFGIL